jgi:hypothetical protein
MRPVETFRNWWGVEVRKNDGGDEVNYDRL